MVVTATDAEQRTFHNDGTPKKWQRSYSRRVMVTDILVIVLSVFGAQQLRFGNFTKNLILEPRDGSKLAIDYTIISILLIAAWLIGLRVVNSRDHKIIGSGSLEYKLVTDTTIKAFGVLSILALILRAPIARGYLIIAFPIGLALLVLSRWAWRKWLLQVRKKGRYLHRAVIAGEFVKTNHVAQQIQRDAGAGFKIVGSVLDNGSLTDSPDDALESNDFTKMIEMVDATQADTLIVTSADAFSPIVLRELGWQLEQRAVEFVVAPALTDIAGPRIHTRPVAGLPLIHVEYPEFTGSKYFIKRLTDIFLSSILILVLSPVLLAVSLAVKLDSHGPLIFKQERIGQNGQPFRMLKFRSMVVDAELKLAALLERSEGNGVLFKMKDDPRVTKVGSFIRRYSLDELPQLFNVLMGDMSLVGPRPPLHAEVDTYEGWVHRRLLVKPGITGLWQVSGRSNLSWDDSIRLDLYYVENWSLLGDLIILYRTIKAVVASEGAY